MFTGLVSDVGEIIAVEERDNLRRLRIRSAYAADSIVPGASIACAGICLTVVAFSAEGAGAWFDVHAARETLDRTLVPEWRVGTRINLERSLRVGDELGGHLVTGHVDGIAVLLRREAVTESAGEWGPTARFTIRAPANLAHFIAEKGSVALDGTSLTVNSIDGDVFSVLLIPHTLAVTTWGERHDGDRLHIEIDLMARYAARLAEARVNGY
ncbi:MAG: riboflavin synthase [Beijerinckiaceae bacterium]